MKPTVILFALVVMCWGCGTQRVTDADDNTYNTVQIGNQVCIAENLNVSHFRNGDPIPHVKTDEDRKSTRLNSSHVVISYAVFCLKKKKTKKEA